jgi:preprotein translocase subunit SecA
MFQETTRRIKSDLISLLSKVVVREEQDVEAVEAQRRRRAPVQFVHADVAAAEAMQPEAPPNAANAPPPAAFAEEQKAPFVRQGRKIGRNEPCPCGSGKKYKQCHGRLA